ncbi:MAG TPA: beta-ketoacyl-ACP synthase III [Actinomycetota bacterium]|nr:beta-ketoacyl-ACP synthase III [Actinomycetota bacterium]
MQISLRSLGKAVPDRVVPNAEIAERLGVDPDWIESRTGIRERRYVGPGESTATLGTAAARQAIERAGLTPQDIGAVVVGTCTPEHQFPSTACVIARNLGMTTAPAFDLSAACSGFVYSLAVGGSLITSLGVRRVLVIGADALSKCLNLDDPVTAPLFGDGAGAAVIERDDDAEPMRFQLGADGAGGEQVFITAGGNYMPPTPEVLEQHLNCMTMHGREVYRSAVRTMTALGAEMGAGGFELLIAHQANRRILADCAEALHLDMAKVYMNIDRYGNTSGASIPVAMCEAWEAGLLSPGDRVLLLAFGGGYTWGGAMIRWTLGPPPDLDTAAAAGEADELMAAVVPQ